MESVGGRILIVDDDRNMCEMLELDLRRRGYAPQWFNNPIEAQECLNTTNFDVILTDIKMPQMNGLQFCQQITEQRPDIPVVVFTAFGSMETAVAAIRAGAYDFVMKPIELDLLALQLERALKHRTLQERIKLLSEEVERSKYTDLLVGESPAMWELYNRLERLKSSETSLLLHGESGTGKELVAHVLHHQSSRSNEPFVPVNCGALPENLLESELFGHVKGAFTGAEKRHKGLFERAHKGTLFLDEIGEMPLGLQVRLLRVIEAGSVRPVGGEEEISFDVRIIAATHKDLELAVEEGTFREDLFFRLNVIQLDIPPLRFRENDILILAQHFLQKFAASTKRDVQQLSKPVIEKLLAYPWPGNVRELRNAMEHAVVLTRHQTIVMTDLPKKIQNYKRLGLPLTPYQENSQAPLVSLDEMEKQYILHVLEKVGGSKTVASKVLGVDRKTLYRKLQKYLD